MNKCHPLRKKYPDRVPVIVEFDERIKLRRGDKTKFLVPEDISFGQFIHILKKMCFLGGQESIFVFVKNTIPEGSSSILKVYENYHNKEDYVLYCTVKIENTFG